jgi:hypothetical protein
MFDESAYDVELEGLFVTPGEILERMNEMKRSVDSLDYDIAQTPKCATDIAFMRDWEAFKMAFSTYLVEFEGYFDRFWGSAMDVASKWSEQITQWQARYARVCKKSASAIKLSDNTQGDLKLKGLSTVIKWVIGGVVTVAVIGAGFYLYKAYRLAPITSTDKK